MKYVIIVVNKNIIADHLLGHKPSAFLPECSDPLTAWNRRWRDVYGGLQRISDVVASSRKEKQESIKSPRNTSQHHYTNLKKAVLKSGLNYGTFQNWKSKNKPSFPIEYKGFLFEKIEVK